MHFVQTSLILLCLDLQGAMKSTRNRIGIMEGRLSRPMGNEIQTFPKHSWKNEFGKAKRCGFNVIEWVFDLYEKNPILSDDGIKEIKTLSKKYNVKINSVCADYFMKNKLFNVTNSVLGKNLEILRKIIKQCRKLDIRILDLPFVDSSSIRNKIYQNQVLSNLQKVIHLAEENNVIIALETDLPPKIFKNFLIRFNHPNIKANYDIGNSVSLGYDTKEELEMLGPWIANVHVKDRIYHGESVPLGTGNVNFDLFFSSLAKINYSDDLIIQGAREDNSMIEPELTCKKYFKFVKRYVDRYMLCAYDSSDKKTT